MPPAQYQRLVENLRKDGILTSAPLIYQDEILSGNHRVKAAIDAGITEAGCIEITSKLSKEDRVSIQLAHNAIAGDDDPNTLEQLYKSLGLDAKTYSGLTDDLFTAAEDVDLESLAIGAPPYMDMVIEFLPEEAIQFEALLARIDQALKGKNPPIRHVAAYDDFDTMFNALVRVKELSGIHNSAIAIRMMAELALERIEQLETIDADTGEAA